ncbi:hypothetical protein A3C37_01420 [Candidatus Peribacteria bacterium RIFCSPHIGHO2_02_FULL_53_20]|nr:MAG: hypothetical protein A3C37_01420 [Candidatus Peribacteria bacterium RIFCSPHIGHO2_02_FULL_53_20]OGJ67163.1 MAG: hypothetical protein A3B61_03230 [Candidatus Peribacteria bacterium RIFCSPLOWO2_01_FULL_53_10]OGJ75000.1 MAG: hypothetical protein A3G69_00735 [Candidatus Peribacteria bacterium RIFCSPLOWO2_12_FULL_53_10]
MTNTQLNEILELLRRMDKRDRLRTWGGFFRSILHLIPLILIIWSTWYAFAHWDELLKEISKAAAEQSAAVMQNQGGDFSKQMQEQLQKLMGQ